MDTPMRMALQLAGSVNEKHPREAGQRCLHIQAVLSSLQQQQQLDPEANVSPAYSGLFKSLSDMLKSQHAAHRAHSLRLLALWLQNCPADMFLDKCTEVATNLYNQSRHVHVHAAEALFACFYSLVGRLRPCLSSPATKTAVAQALSKAAAAAQHLMQTNQPTLRRNSFLIVIQIAQCMPQALKSQTNTISSACLAALAPGGGTALPLRTRLLAAHALACMAACTATGEGWALHVRELLSLAHSALASLPMPGKDAALGQAATDVLAGAVSPQWAKLEMPTATAPLLERVELVTLLIHSLACALAESAPLMVPLPMAALVLLASRLLSLRPSAPAPAGLAAVEGCQWSCVTVGLVNTGASAASTS